MVSSIKKKIIIDIEKNIRIMYFAVDTLTSLLIDLIYNFDIANRT